MSIFDYFRTKSAGAGELERILLETFGAPAGSTAATTAMRQATVWACVAVLAKSQAVASVRLMQRNADGTRKRVYTHPVAELLRKPNDYQTTYDFAYDIGQQLAMYGNFHAKIIRGTGKRPVNLLQFPVKALKAERDKQNGDIFYRGVKRYAQNEILHFRGVSFDTLNGVSPIEYNRGTVGVAVKAGDHANKILKSGGRPAGILSLIGKTVPTNVEKLRKLWNSGDVAGKTEILSNGDKYIPISMNNAELQYIEVAQLKLTEICAIFGVPPHMVADVTKSADSNLSAQNIQFIKHTMLPTCMMVEQRYSASLLTSKEVQEGFYITHNLAVLERADLLTRADAAIKFRTAGIKTSNELRQLEDLPPHKDGDDLKMPLNSSATTKIEDNDEN